MNKTINEYMDSVMHGCMPNTIPSVVQHSDIVNLDLSIRIAINTGQKLPKYLLGKLGLCYSSAKYISSKDNVADAVKRLVCTGVVTELGMFAKDLPNRIKFNDAIIKTLGPLIQEVDKYNDKVST